MLRTVFSLAVFLSLVPACRAGVDTSLPQTTEPHSVIEQTSTGEPTPVAPDTSRSRAATATPLPDAAQDLVTWGHTGVEYRPASGEEVYSLTDLPVSNAISFSNGVVYWKALDSASVERWSGSEPVPVPVGSDEMATLVGGGSDVDGRPVVLLEVSDRMPVSPHHRNTRLAVHFVDPPSEAGTMALDGTQTVASAWSTPNGVFALIQHEAQNELVGFEPTGDLRFRVGLPSDASLSLAPATVIDEVWVLQSYGAGPDLEPALRVWRFDQRTGKLRSERWQVLQLGGSAVDPHTCEFAEVGSPTTLHCSQLFGPPFDVSFSGSGWIASPRSMPFAYLGGVRASLN